jgi:hypothetical protein
MGGARASHCVRLHVPGGGDPAAQLCGVTEDVISTGRVESAVVYATRVEPSTDVDHEVRTYECLACKVSANSNGQISLALSSAPRCRFPQ